MFLSFKRTTLGYLLKISIAHNKKHIPSLNLPNNCISAKSAPQVLSIKGKFFKFFINWSPILFFQKPHQN